MATPEASIRLVISADNLAGPAIDGLNKALASIASALERISGTGKTATGELNTFGRAAGPADAVATAVDKVSEALSAIAKEAPQAGTAIDDASKSGADAVAKLDSSVKQADTAFSAVGKAAEQAGVDISKFTDGAIANLAKVRAAAEETAAAIASAGEATAAGAVGGAAGAGTADAVGAAAAGAAGAGAGGAAAADAAAVDWKKAGTAAHDFGMQLLTVGAVAGAIGGVAVVLGVKFQTAMELIHTQAGASQAEVNNLSTAVLKLAGTVPQGPTQLADALYHLESVGLRGSRAMDALKVAAEGAAIGQASLNDTTYALSSAVNTGIRGTQNFNEAMGALVAIAGSGDMHMQDLAQAMSSGVLPAAASAGLSLTDVGAALATLTDNGVPAEQAATRLRMTISLLSAPTKIATTQLATIGVTQLQLANDMRNHGLLSALEDLKTHLIDSGLTASQQGEIIARSFGGGKSSATIITLLDSLDRLQSKYKLIDAGAKHFGADWAATQKETSVAFGTMVSGLESVGIQLGNQLMPMAQKAMQAIDGLVRAFDRLPPGTIHAIAVGIAAITAALIPMGIALVVAGAVMKLGEAFDTLGPAMDLMLGPVGLVIVGLAALALGIALVVTHWKQITTWMRTNAPGAFKVATEAVHTMAAALHTAFGAIARLVNQVWTEIAGWTKAHWSEIEAVVKVVVEALRVLFAVEFNLIAGVIKGAWNGIKITTTGVWDVIKGTIKLAVDLITGILGVFLDLVTGHWSKAWTNFRDLIKNVWDDIKTIITGAIDVITGPLNVLAGTIGGLISGAKNAVGAVAGVVSAGNSTTHSTLGSVQAGAKIPKLAGGGIVSAPTLAVVGESGPEAVIPLNQNPLNASAIAPLPGGGGAGGHVININITGVAADPKTLAQMVANEINRSVKFTTRGAWAV